MMKLIILLSIVTFSLSDVILSIPNITYVSFVDYSGKLLIGVNETSYDIFFEVEKIEEKDSDNNKITQNGQFVDSPNHTICVNDTPTYGINNSSGVNNIFIVRNCILPNNAALSYIITVYTEDGTVTHIENEKFNVRKGDVKIAIQLNRWNFSSEATTIDMVITLKSENKNETNHIVNEKRTSLLSSGKSITFSRFVDKDAEVNIRLDDNNPVPILNGFRLSFPKFDTFILYNQIIHGYHKDIIDNTPSDNNMIAIIIIAIVLGVMFLIGIILVYFNMKQNKVRTYERVDF